MDLQNIIQDVLAGFWKQGQIRELSTVNQLFNLRPLSECPYNERYLAALYFKKKLSSILTYYVTHF